MALAKKLGVLFRIKARSWKEKTFENKVKIIKNEPQDYLALGLFKNLRTLGRLFLSPFQLQDVLQRWDEAQVTPSEGLQLHIPDAVLVYFVIRTLLHVSVALSQKFAVITDGNFTMDGIAYLLALSGLCMITLATLFLRAQRRELGWFFNQSLTLHKNFSGCFLVGKSVISVFGKDPSLLLFLFLGHQLRFLVPPLAIVAIVITQHSPLFLPSVMESWIGGTFAFYFLLFAETCRGFAALAIFYVPAVILIVPMFVVIFCIRSLRSDELRNLSWRQRKRVYVQLELLNNTFGDAIIIALPVMLAHVTSAVVASLVCAVKFAGMSVSLILPLGAAMAAFNYGSGCLVLLKIAESLEIQSLGLLDDLRVDIDKKLKSRHVSALLTRRRLIRYNLGHFMFIESGTALACAMAVLENTVSAIVMVMPTPTCYFFGL